MDRLYIIHGFERESTFLVDVSTSVLQEPREEAEIDSDHDRFMQALPLLPNGHQRTNKVATELGVMQVMPINGLETFHKRFVKECAMYCRLQQRLQHAVEWLLAGHLTFSPARPTQHIPCDVDGLSSAVYPLEPTAFAAAAFALPPLLSVVPAHPQNVEVARAASIAPVTSIRLYENGNKYHESLDSLQTVPYCLFYSSIVPSVSSSSVLPLTARFSAVAIATGVCGAVSSSDSTLRSNRSKNGLSLSSYIEGLLPRSVYNGFSTSGTVDPFAQWSEGVLWRLLSSLVSALTVVHASGMHYRGELTASDILCFALPNDVSAVPQQGAGMPDNLPKNTAGRRITEWVASTHNRWIITDGTPAHQAYFMITTLPCSLFSDDSRIPADVIAAQRRDVAALGRLLITVLEETKRRRVNASHTSSAGALAGCSELLFVAERMAAVDQNATISIGEAPANRFAQLQAVRLRTQLCLLRATLEEQQALLTAELHRRGGQTAHSRDNGHRDPTPPKLLSGTQTIPNLSCSVELAASESDIRERERLLSEREEKLNRFLELYELTSERLDNLPFGKEGYNRLKESLRLNPLPTTTTTTAAAATTTTTAAATTTTTAITGASPTTWRKNPDSPESPSPQMHVPLPTSLAVESRVGPLYGLLRFPKSEKSPSNATNTPTTTTNTTATTASANEANTLAAVAAVAVVPSSSAAPPRNSSFLNAKSRSDAKLKEKPLLRYFEKSNTHPSGKPWGRSREKSMEKVRDKNASAGRVTFPVSPGGGVTVAAAATAAPVAAAPTTTIGAVVTPTATTAATTTATPTFTPAANRTATVVSRATSRPSSMHFLHTNWKTVGSGMTRDALATSMTRTGVSSKTKGGPSNLNARPASSSQHVQQGSSSSPPAFYTPPRQTRSAPTPAIVTLSPELSPLLEKSPPARGFSTPPLKAPLQPGKTANSGESSQCRTPSLRSWRRVQMSPPLSTALHGVTSPRHMGPATPPRQKTFSPMAAAAKWTPSSSSAGPAPRSRHSAPSAHDSPAAPERSPPWSHAGPARHAVCTPVREGPQRDPRAAQATPAGDGETPLRQRRLRRSGSSPTHAFGGGDSPEPEYRESGGHSVQQSPELRSGGTAKRVRNGSEKKLRSLRPRAVDDGWIDDHLAALDQLRCDFLQSGTSKSLRSTPNGKTLRGNRPLRFSPDHAVGHAVTPDRGETATKVGGKAMRE